MAGPEWLKRVREAAAAELESATMPSATEELWRYSRIDELDLDLFKPSTSSLELFELPETVANFLEAIGERAGLVVTSDGHLVKSEISDRYAAKGLLITPAGESTDDASFGLTTTASDYFTHLNTAFSPDPLLVDIPAGVVVETPIVIVHWAATDGIVSCPRVSIRIGENAQATVVEYLVSDLVSDDVRSLVVPVTEMNIARSSNLHYVAVQCLGTSVWQIASQISRVQRDATLHSTAISFGGDFARVSTESHLVGIGASSKLNAVYFGNGSQMHDFRTLQAHDAPKTTSNLMFKGAVGDSSRSAYSGMIRVSKGAAGTSAFQTNRNIVLSPGAHADSVPNLEIEENDVKCSHASATGPIDEDQRYYLESRGVPPEVADRLIVQGFLAELLLQTPVPGIYPLLNAQVARKLDDVDSKVK